MMLHSSATNNYIIRQSLCKTLQMGCSQSLTALAGVPELSRIQSVVGLLNVTVENCKLQGSLNLCRNRLYAKVRVSNQEKWTEKYDDENAEKDKSINNKGKEKSGEDKSKSCVINFRDTFEFIINSCYKIYGRMLIVQIWDRHSPVNGVQLGEGIIDLDPYLQRRQLTASQHQKVYLTKGMKEVGWVDLRIKFQQHPYENIAFKINSVFIRKALEGVRYCSCRLTIGEEVQQTRPKKDNQDVVPSWKGEPKVFRVPSFIEEAIIEVIQKNGKSNLIVGELHLNLKQLMSTRLQLMHNQSLYVDETVTGAISFDTIKGQEVDYIFKDIQSHKNIRNKRREPQTYTHNLVRVNRNMLDSEGKQIPDNQSMAMVNTSNTLNTMPQLCIQKDIIVARSENLHNATTDSKADNFRRNLPPIEAQKLGENNGSDQLNRVQTKQIKSNKCKQDAKNNGICGSESQVSFGQAKSNMPYPLPIPLDVFLKKNNTKLGGQVQLIRMHEDIFDVSQKDPSNCGNRGPQVPANRRFSCELGIENLNEPLPSINIIPSGDVYAQQIESPYTRTSIRLHNRESVRDHTVSNQKPNMDDFRLNMVPIQIQPYKEQYQNQQSPRDIFINPSPIHKEESQSPNQRFKQHTAFDIQQFQKKTLEQEIQRIRPPKLDRQEENFSPMFKQMQNQPSTKSMENKTSLGRNAENQQGDNLTM